MQLFFYVIYFVFSYCRDSNICPIDHEEIASNQIYPDRAKEREILLLICFCTNVNFGCKWTGTVKLLQVINTTFYRYLIS